MSRQSKQARLNKAAKQMSEQRKNGNKGAAKTTPKHGKNPANRLAHNNVSRQGVTLRKQQD